MKVLVTGGASGLGRAITEAIAAQPDHEVWFTYHHSAEKAADLLAHFSNVRSIRVDFGDAVSLAHLLSVVHKEQFDALVNNAYSGKFIQANFDKLKVDDFQTDFQQNILPVIQLTQACIGQFKKKKFGRIITILSAALYSKRPVGASSYLATKAYLGELSKVWASEYTKFNISSNTISPSFMKTALTSEMDERLIDHIIEKHPLGKLLELHEVAQSVTFLLSSPTHYNGMNLLINAGMD